MDLYELIQSLETFIFEVASWFVFIPRTMVFVLFKPHRILGFVQDEFKKPKEKRFQSVVSPPLFWILVGILPSVGLFEAAAVKCAFRLDLSAESALLIFSICLVSGPIAFATAILFGTRKTISRVTLQPLFYAQCYLFAPYLLVATWLIVWYLVFPIVVSPKSECSSPVYVPGFSALSLFLDFIQLWFYVAEALLISECIGPSQSRMKHALLTGSLFLLSFAIWSAMSGAIVGGYLVFDVIGDLFK